VLAEEVVRSDPVFGRVMPFPTSSLNVEGASNPGAILVTSRLTSSIGVGTSSFVAAVARSGGESAPEAEVLAAAVLSSCSASVGW
jgi:hypothetical protein